MTRTTIIFCAITLLHTIPLAAVQKSQRKVFSKNAVNKSTRKMWEILTCISTEEQKTRALTQLLKTSNPKINSIYDEKWTILSYVSFYNFPSLVKLFLEYGANHMQDSYGKTPLIHAIEQNNLPIAKLLIEHAALTNPSSLSPQPLICASLWKRKDMVQLLIEQDISLDACGKDGKTPLMAASLMASFEIITLLVANDADIMRRNTQAQYQNVYDYTIEKRNCMDAIQAGKEMRSIFLATILVPFIIPDLTKIICDYACQEPIHRLALQKSGT